VSHPHQRQCNGVLVDPRFHQWFPQSILLQSCTARKAHELRNEVVEELIIDYVSESHAEPDVESMRDGRTSGMESKNGRRREELRTSLEKRPGGSTRRSKLVREEGTQRLSRRC
jgi:hypothetical protein